MRVRSFEPGDEASWDRYVLDRRGHFGLSLAWKEIMSAGHGCRARYFTVEDGGERRGVMPLFQKENGGRALFSAPGGLLADDDAAAAALLARARELVAEEGLDYLELRDQARAWPGLATNEENVTMVLPLARGPKEQLAEFSSHVRNRIAKGESAGLTARWGRDQLGRFHALFVEGMRDLGTPVRGIEHFSRLAGILGDKADVLIVERAGEAVGGLLCVEHAGTLSVPWTCSLRRHFASCPNHVLYWEAAKRAISRGLERVDFGRAQAGSSVFQFKKKWGALPVPLYYQYVLGKAAEMPTVAGQKARYRSAAAIWKSLPLFAARALGDAARRRFPEAF